MAAKASDDQQTYGIGAVARLTGLTDHTIRAWERRYHAVVAQRTAGGRREYTPADVEKLSLLKALTDNGVSIGLIARESLGELRERARSLNRLAAVALPERIAVAVLGELLPARLVAEEAGLAPLVIEIADSSEERFEADLKTRPLDVVVLETPVLGAGTGKLLDRYLAASGAVHAVLVFGFGRRADVERLGRKNVIVLRSPVTPGELRSAIVAAFMTGRSNAGRRSAAKPPVAEPEWRFEGPVAARRFTREQLASLASASTTVQCECPRHLADLVGALGAFEVYSASCASRNDEDAALHRYLQRTTGEARALIEAALARVAAAEGIEY